MNVFVCSTQADAVAYQTSVDAALGYPREGVEVGAGAFHVSKAEARTYHQAGILKHPTLAFWAYLDGPALGDAHGIAHPPSSTLQALDATWFPPVVGVL